MNSKVIQIVISLLMIAALIGGFASCAPTVPQEKYSKVVEDYNKAVKERDEALAKLKATPVLAADTILYNGKIYTADKNFSIAQAVAIRDGRFLAVGSDAVVKVYAGPNTKMVDLKGKAVTPGLIDAHCHPIGVGTNAGYPIQLMQVRTYDDLINALRDGAKKGKPGEWLVTAPNWLSFNFRAEDMPTLKVLDEIFPNNPLWLACGAHRGHTNSLGLKLAGITKDTPDPPGGTICKDPKTGELTGRLEEGAQYLVKKLLPKPVDEVTALRNACKFENSIGVTGIQVDGEDEKALIAYQTLKKSGELTMRCGINMSIDPKMSDKEVFAMIHAIAGAALGGLGDDMVKVGGIKTVAESLYPMPGIAMWPRDRLRDICLEIAKNKLRFVTHSNAGMNEELLGIMKEVNEKYSIKDLRWGLVHQRFTNPAMIQLNKDLGLCAHQDVAFGLLSLTLLEVDRKKALPPDRLYCPLPLWIKAGVPLSLNTDAGGACTELSVWNAIYAATHRQLFPDFNPEFNISREEALKLATMGGAYRMMMEDKIGSIEVGKLADLAILVADPLTCKPEQLHDMTAVMTILGGKIVYEAK